MLGFKMPVEIFWGDEVIQKKGEIFKKSGQKALIVTGKKSSKINGSLADVEAVLQDMGIEYILYDHIPENPDFKSIDNGAILGKEAGADFCIGLGGGSPMDSAKAIALLIKNPSLKAEDLYTEKQLSYIPVICVPTTAGTGSETTPYSILTIKKKQTKKSIPQKVWPEYAFIDTRYFESMPREIFISAALDALSHLLEGYLCVNASCLSDSLAESGLRAFRESKNVLSKADHLEREKLGKLIQASTIAGMVIAQTGTSIPHGLSYYLTIRKGLRHGEAVSIFLYDWLANYPDNLKVVNALKLLGFSDLKEFKGWLEDLLVRVQITEREICDWAEEFSGNRSKLKNYPAKLMDEDIRRILKNSCR